MLAFTNYPAQRRVLVESKFGQQGSCVVRRDKISLVVDEAGLEEFPGSECSRAARRHVDGVFVYIDQFLVGQSPQVDGQSLLADSHDAGHVPGLGEMILVEAQVV